MRLGKIIHIENIVDVDEIEVDLSTISSDNNVLLDETVEVV